MSERYIKILKNTGIILAGNAGTGLVEFLLLPLYTRWLSVPEYGVADLLKVYATILISFVSCSIADSLFVFPKGQNKQTQKRYFSSAFFFLLIATILSCFIFTILNIGGKLLDAHNSFFNYIWLILGIVISKMFLKAIQQFARGIDQIAAYSFTGTIVAISLVISSFFLIPVSGVEGFAVSMMISNVIGCFFSLVVSKGYQYLDWCSCNRHSLSEMLKYSLPLLPNGIMWWIIGALNRPIMEAKMSFHDIGIYAVANKFPGIIGMFFAVFAISWQTSVMEEYGKNDFGSFYNIVARTFFFFLVLICLLLSVCSKPMIELFTVSDYYSAWIYVPILTLGTVFSAFASAGGVIFSAAKESKYFFYSSMWGAFVAISLNFALVPFLGIFGAVLSVVLSFLALAISRICFAWKFVNLDNLTKYAATSVCAFVSALAVYMPNYIFFVVINLIMLIIVCGINIDIIKKIMIVVK